MQRTVNYDLCQYEGSDKTSYLINYNGDMLKIDTAIKAAKDAADTAQATASGADGKADSVAADVSTLNTQINGASGLAADVATVQGSVNTINSLIGNGEPTTTNKTLIGAINELNSDKCADSKVGDLADLTTTDKTSIVAAINEVAGGQGGAVGDWTLAGTETGTTAVNVPATVKEMLIFCEFPDNNLCEVHALAALGTKAYVSGAYASSNIGRFASVTYDSSANTVALGYAAKDGGDVTSTSSITVYYK